MEPLGIPETDPADLTASELGSLLGRKTEKVDKPCLQCQALMTGVTVRREFCSAKCRQKHWRLRLFSLKPGEEMTYVNGPRRGLASP